jgi:hypothetical protein
MPRLGPPVEAGAATGTGRGAAAPWIVDIDYDRVRERTMPQAYPRQRQALSAYDRRCSAWQRNEPTAARRELREPAPPGVALMCAA